MNGANPKVDFYFSKAKKWQAELRELRRIALECQLTEELKWGVPCFTDQNANIVLIHAFKEYCAYLFFKGALLKDSERILIQQTKNVQAGRQIRLTSLAEIGAMEPILKAYIHEAVGVEEAGLKVAFQKVSDLIFPEEFIDKLDEIAGLKAAFDALSPGRQKGYNLYFSAAKQAKTRIARIEKCLPKILDGKGLDD